MKISNETPNKTFLIVILIGTTLLALPAAFGTVLLFDHSYGATVNTREFSGQILAALSVTGFLLFSGYIITAALNRHSRMFWLMSGVYNTILSVCYAILLCSLLSELKTVSVRDLPELLTNPLLLLPFWTIFVTYSSFYYFKFTNNKLELS